MAKEERNVEETFYTRDILKRDIAKDLFTRHDILFLH